MKNPFVGLDWWMALQAPRGWSEVSGFASTRRALSLSHYLHQRPINHASHAALVSFFSVRESHKGNSRQPYWPRTDCRPMDLDWLALPGCGNFVAVEMLIADCFCWLLLSCAFTFHFHNTRFMSICGIDLLAHFIVVVTAAAQLSQERLQIIVELFE
jgi:hypothetical protein